MLVLIATTANVDATNLDATGFIERFSLRDRCGTDQTIGDFLKAAMFKNYL